MNREDEVLREIEESKTGLVSSAKSLIKKVIKR